MKRTTKKPEAPAPAAGAPAEIAVLNDDGTQSDDELEIRFSLTALGELAVAQGGRGGRGRRFRGFGPCGAVA